MLIDTTLHQHFKGLLQPFLFIYLFFLQIIINREYLFLDSEEKTPDKLKRIIMLMHLRHLNMLKR